MTSETAFSRKDAFFSALAVAILVIGTATGSAIAMFVMSLIALLLAAVFHRKRLSGRLLLPMASAALIATGVGLIMSLK
jgi:large-conductance mechanosensitive channel